MAHRGEGFFREPLWAGGVATLLVGLLTCAYRLGWDVPLITDVVDSLELRILDWRFALRGPTEPGPEVVIVAFDDRTMSEAPELFERRDGWVRVIEALNAARPAAIGVDAVFVDPERLLSQELTSDLERYLDAPSALPECRPAHDLLVRIGAEAAADDRLVAAVARAGVMVLGYHLGTSGGFESDDPSLSKSYCGQALLSAVPATAADQVLASLPALNQAARALGVITVSEDVTRSVRQLVGFRRYGSALALPLAIELVAVARGIPKGNLACGLTGPDGRPALMLGDQAVPLDVDHGLWLNYRGGAGTIPTYAWIDLIEGRIGVAELAGRIVLVGYTYFGHDTAQNPFTTALPGVEVHATAVDNLLRGDFLHRAAWWQDLLAVLVLGALVSFLFWRRLSIAPGLQVAGALGLTAGTLVFEASLFIWAEVWMFALGPSLVALLATGGCLVQSYMVEGRERRRLRHAFAHYLSAEVIEELLKRPEALRPGGERRVLTVLFSDIRGFTRLCERLSPEEVTELLNRYFTPMTAVVLENRGLLDKYIGDAIMAIYGAPVHYPEHAQAACETALQMTARLDALQPELERRGLPRLAIGIGINTGPMSVGNMGSLDRFDYTVVGDHVNLASRLEGLNKKFGTTIVVSEQTRLAAGPEFVFRELDVVEVAGKSEPVRTFELLQRGPASAELARKLALFEQGLSDYRHGFYAHAAEAFFQAERVQPDPVSKLYQVRCACLREDPPPSDWDGVFRSEK